MKPISKSVGGIYEKSVDLKILRYAAISDDGHIGYGATEWQRAGQ
jgi:hypothetical protein